MPTERFCCPMCGWWRTSPYGVNRKTGEVRELRFDKVDPATAPMYRLDRLAGAGRGSPKAIVEHLEEKTLSELPEELKEQIRAQSQRILAALEQKPKRVRRTRT